MIKIGDNIKVLSIQTSLIFFSMTSVYADINGTVFRDLPVNGSVLNSYGVQENNELGVEGITVTAYFGDHNSSTTTTTSDGSWFLATTGDARVEFSNIPAYLKESFNGSVQNSSVRFVSNGGTVNFALHNPNDYSNTATPPYVTNRQQNGSGVDNSNPAIETVQYTYTGLNHEFINYIGNRGTGMTPLVDTVVEEVGSIWGKAFQKDQQRLFAASVLQRHVGFAPNKGAADVYVVDYRSTPATFQGSFSLQGVVPSNGGAAIDLGSVCRSVSCKDDLNNTGIATDYLLSSSVAVPNIDLDAFAKVGKMSYGDIDFDQTHHKLWLVNLYQKALISVDASGDFTSLASASVNQYLIESIPNVPSCTGGELRPWALNIHEGRGYLGAVCDASSSQNIHNARAYVLSFDIGNPMAGFVHELDFGLDYVKDASNSNKNWHPWSDSDRKIGHNWKYYNQPILSDIEFDAQNNMYISLLDRYGLQAGYKNFEPISETTLRNEKTKSNGDIFRVCDHNGTFELEGTGSCTQTNYGDEFFNDEGGDTSEEYANGALALLKGSKEIVVGMVDPHPQGDRGRQYWNTMGENTLSLEDGSIKNWYANIYTAGNNGYNGKSQGMGDIELLTVSSPVEIGDRVWSDSDGDGIQDANESGISGVTVELVCGGMVKATASTNSQGVYLFSNDPQGTSDASHQYGINALAATVDNCTIRIPHIKGTQKQASLGSRVLTFSNRGEGVNSKLNDSDGIEVGTDAQRDVSELEIPIAGANNHSFDFGFKPIPTSPRFQLGDYVWLDTNHDGVQDGNESGLNGVTVNLYATADCTGEINATTLTANGGLPAHDGYYLFSSLEAGSYCLAFSNLPANYIISATTGANDTTNSDANASAMIANIHLVSDDLDEDMGLYPATISVVPTVHIGDRVWVESDNDGNASTGTVTPLVGVTVTATDTITGNRYTAVTDTNGTYLLAVPQNRTYLVTLSTPRGYRATANSTDGNVTDTFTEENQSHNGSGTTVVMGTVDNLTVDFGFVLAPVTPPPSTPTVSTVSNTSSSGGGNDVTTDIPVLEEGEPQKVCFGDRVWNDLNHNGLQDEDEPGIEDVKVTLYAANCNTELNVTQTDALGYYHFSNLEIGDYCVGFSEFSTDYMITFKDEGEDDSRDSDVNRESNKTDSFFLDGLENDECNVSIDMGLFEKNECGEIILRDDSVNANENGASTEINVVDNDLTLGSDTVIKLLSPALGERFWMQGNAEGLESSMLLDTLTVAGEGIWQVENGAITFTAYDSFEGEVPTPVYYVVQGVACDAATAGVVTYSNIAQVSINTPCGCQTYTSSIPSLHTLSIVMLMFLTSTLIVLFLRKENS